MNKLIKNSLGLAQIPLMIMLLLMAIAVPVATKLVQDSADTRNLAVGGGVGKAITTTSPKVTAPKLANLTPIKKPGDYAEPYDPKEPTPIPMGDRGSNPPKTCASMSGVSDGSACYAAGCNWEASVKICSGTYPTNRPFVTVKPTTAFNDIVCCKIGTGAAFQTDETDCRARAGTLMGEKTCGNGVELVPTLATSTTCTEDYECGAGQICNPSGLCVVGTPVLVVGPSITLAPSNRTCTLDSDCQVGQKCSAGTCVSSSTSSGGSSSGGAPIATATKKPSSGGSSSGGSTTGSNDTANCHEQCPGTDGVLYSCTPPEADGSSTASKCETAGRVEGCGGQSYCCPVANGAWTSDMTKCPAVSPTLPAGQSPILNYKVAYGGVVPSASQCVVDWPLQFIVLGGGESKAYTNIIPPTKTTVGSKLQFSGSLILTGFTKTTNIAAFIKGPKHLQVKYGINNQNSAYNKAGGELTLTTDYNTSPIYDFTNFPIVPGDVVGTNSDNGPDGWINGVDFAYVKSKSIAHETVDAGGYLKGDLDGNCQVNSNDVNLLKISLQEKQEQLY